VWGNLIFSLKEQSYSPFERKEKNRVSSTLSLRKIEENEFDI
jgi:hypothetical protein